MTVLIFPDQAAFATFEAKMMALHGLPLAGRSAKTGEIVDPERKTGEGWTLRHSSPVAERGGLRVMTRIDADIPLAAVDQARIETRASEIAKFGPVRSLSRSLALPR